MRKYIKRFNTLPKHTRQLLGLSAVLGLMVALPLFIFSLSNKDTNYDIRDRAEPLACPVLSCAPGYSPSCPTIGEDGCPVCSCVPSGNPIQTPGNITFPTSTPTETPTATPTAQPWYQTLKFRIKFAGVDLGQADGAKIKARIFNSKANINHETSAFVVNHIGQGIYEGLISFETNAISPTLPADNDYSIFIKGEKHLARKFCDEIGQTSRCSGNGLIHIEAANSPEYSQTFDFTGLLLEPGDVSNQNGVVNAEDFIKIKNLLSKPCASLTSDEKLIGDLDYSGCVNTRDTFLIRKTLENKYDEE